MGIFLALGRPLTLEIKEQVTAHEIAKVAGYTATWHHDTLEFDTS